MKKSFVPFLISLSAFAAIAFLMGGCASSSVLAGGEAPAPEAGEFVRPSWAQPQNPSEEATLDETSPAVTKLEDAGPEEDAVDGTDENPEEVKPKKKGFWIFGSKKEKPAEEETPAENESPEQEPKEEPEVVEAPEEEEKGPQGLPRIDQGEVGAYKLKSGDILMISLTGSGGLNDQIETVVDDEGGVKLRFIGSVKAEGLTPTELEREIEAEYIDRKKIYKSIVARVVVPNRFYFIGREVRAPGRYPIVGKVSLSQAISAAGNFTEWANERKIILVRGNERYQVDFREISKDPTKDILLQPGDSITVERRILF